MAAGGDGHAGSFVAVAQADQQAARSMAPAPPEPEVLALGLRLAELGSGVKARAYEMSKVTELLLTLAMRKPSFQAQLFRLVDVFPAMSDAADTGRHVEEYFERGLAPLPVAAGAQVANRLPLGRVALARVTRREVMRMASQFIVGSDPAEVARELRAMWEGGTAATIDLLGEHTYSHHEADAYAARLLELLSALIDVAPAWPERPVLESDDLGPLPRVAVSIKPSALAPDFHPLTAEAGIESASRRLRPVLELAAERGAQVWFDMERYEAKSLTTRLFQELLEDPALRDLRAAADDLIALARWSAERMRRTGALPIAIRLVKGAYWDTETIVSEASGWP